MHTGHMVVSAPPSDRRDDAVRAVPAWAAPAATIAAVALIAAAALWLRVDGLAGRDGTLSVDEARLALAARGILEHGIPVLPSGWTYTRGILSAYLLAPALWLLGPTDFAARLPSALAGAALVPAMYALASQVAGRAGGLFAALLVAGHGSLVIWSRQAWFYSLYVLLFTLALLCIVRSHRRSQPRDQLLAGLFVGLTFFAHELGVFLLVPLGAQVAVAWRRTGASPGERRAAIGAGGIVGAAGLLSWLLVTSLRATSLVGAYGEVDEYFRPRLTGANASFYVRMLLDGPGLMLAAACASVVLAVARRRFVTLLLWLALLPPFAHAAFVIPRGPQERYGLTLVVVLVALAAESIVGWSAVLAERLRRNSGAARGSWAIGPVLLAVVFLAHQDVARTIERAALNPREGSWLREARALGIGADDVVLTDVPTIAGWYVGGVDYWLTSREYEKYATPEGELLRDVHTGAVIVRNRRDFERLVARAHAGRTIWVVASGRSYQWGELVDDDLKAFLDRSAVQRSNPGDGMRIWRMQPSPPS